MRFQLALNVDNMQEAVAFYSKMFNTTPAKQRPGYANFIIVDPPLKLVLFEGAGEAGSINHLGVETDTADEVTTADKHFVAQGLQTTGAAEATCCYAEKTETWLTAPDGNQWEWYVKTADSELMSTPQEKRSAPLNSCC